MNTTLPTVSLEAMKSIVGGQVKNPPSTRIIGVPGGVPAYLPSWQESVYRRFLGPGIAPEPGFQPKLTPFDRINGGRG